MRTIKPLAVIALGFFLGIPWPGPSRAKAAPLDLKGKTLKQVFDELLPGMGARDQGARREPQQKWQAICVQVGAPGNEALRKQACKLMAEKLGPQTPAPAREWLLKQLERIGRGDCVDAVAALLTDTNDRIRDAAIRCLANSPAPRATGKLVASLSAARGRARVGLLNALGQRADGSAVPALAKELASPEAAVAVAAARALGKIASPEAARALAAARGKAEGQVRFWIADSYLLCADRRLREGNTAEAVAIYRELNRPREGRSIRLAALRGTLRCAGDAAGATILAIFGGKDADARAIAISAIGDLNAEALKTVAAGLDRLPPASQVMVLGALAARGDPSQKAVALAATRSRQENVQQAGLRALGRLGDASVVPLLVETLLTKPRLADAARDGLTRVTGKGVNEKIVALLQAEKEVGKRGTLIGVLESRKAAAAVPVLLQDAAGADAGLRARAMAALKQLAGPKDVPALIRAMLQAKQGREREEAERCVAAVCGKTLEPQKRAEPVLIAFDKAGKAERVALLPLLGRIGGPKAHEVVRAAVKSDAAELAEAGRLALCNWPDTSVSEELVQLAEDTRDQAGRLRALQALIRVNTVPGGGENAQRLARLKKAMELASRAEERRQALHGLATVRAIETLRFVLPYLDSKDLAQDACRTVVELAHSRKLREPNKAEFERALDRVIALCKDRGLVERAKRYREGR
jgi:HEAT repeat protein